MSLVLTFLYWDKLPKRSWTYKTLRPEDCEFEASNLHRKTLSKTKQNLDSQYLCVYGVRDFSPDGLTSPFKAYVGAKLQSNRIVEAKLFTSWGSGSKAREEVPVALQR